MTSSNIITTIRFVSFDVRNPTGISNIAQLFNSSSTAHKDFEFIIEIKYRLQPAFDYTDTYRYKCCQLNCFKYKIYQIITEYKYNLFSRTNFRFDNPLVFKYFIRIGLFKINKWQEGGIGSYDIDLTVITPIKKAIINDVDEPKKDDIINNVDEPKTEEVDYEIITQS